MFDENARMSSHPPDRFQLATNEREVVNALRDAMQYWSPEDLARIPSNEILVALETLFARACRRISELENAVVRAGRRDAHEAS